MLAIVDINGCILNFAIKKPAIIAKHVVRIIQTTKANTALPAGAILEKSNICPNTPPVLMPLCIIIVEATMPIPTIRPTERSVPVKRINPATPRAKNILGDACCKILSMFVYVRSCVFLTTGVIAHNAIKSK